MSVDLGALLAELRQESDHLVAHLETLTSEQWSLPTPAPGWTIRDQVSHLAFFDDTARLALTDPEKFRAIPTGVGYSQGASYRTGLARAVEVVEHMPPAQRRAVPAAEGYPTATYEGQAEAVAMGDVDDVAMLPTIRSTIR